MFESAVLNSKGEMKEERKEFYTVRGSGHLTRPYLLRHRKLTKNKSVFWHYYSSCIIVLS